VRGAAPPVVGHYHWRDIHADLGPPAALEVLREHGVSALTDVSVSSMQANNESALDDFDTAGIDAGYPAACRIGTVTDAAWRVTA